MSLPTLPTDIHANYTVHPQVLALIDTKQYAQRTPEWYERRKTLMTASNVAQGALGIKPYDSFRGDARAECIKQLVGGTFKGSVATQHGVIHEDMVRDRLCELMGETVLEFGLLVHPQYEWLGASPDGITLSGRMIEIKCPYMRKIIPGHVPHHYLPQVYTQMEVCDLDSCYFCQWQPAHLNKEGTGEIFDIVLVERDKAWFERHREDMYRFWCDLMKAREEYVAPPPPTCLISDSLYPLEEDIIIKKRSCFLEDD